MELKPCAFCVWCSHDFPDDDEHEDMHMRGYHACALQEGFFAYKPDCPWFAVGEGAWSSV